MPYDPVTKTGSKADYYTYGTICTEVEIDVLTGENQVICSYCVRLQGGTSFVDYVCYLCLVSDMLLHLFIAALWSPAGKQLTSWVQFVMFNYVFVRFPCGILCQMWFLI